MINRSVFKIVMVYTIISLSQYAQSEADNTTNLYWGDTHLHTGNSFDAYLYGAVTATPEIAYRFAMGLPVISPASQMRWQLSSPLDFLVVADHAEALGAVRQVFAGAPTISTTKSGKVIRAMGGEKSLKELLGINDLLENTAMGRENEYGLTAMELYQDLHADDKRLPAWNNYIKTADRYNVPGVFTALIGWEWTSNRDAANLHRVVFMPQDAGVAAQFLPFSSMESTDPEDLWAWLQATSDRTGADFVAIPHNSNISKGRMFPLVTEKDKPIDAEYAKTRMRWEPVVEATQIKGDSETHPLLSPTDEFADYETYQFILDAEGGTPDPTPGDYVRSGLKRGLEFKSKLGANPFKFGMIGSTDSHTGISAVEENNFAGKSPHDSSPQLRTQPSGLGSAMGWDMGAAGFVGAWAHENTRQSLVDAFKRKEVYATTGSRIVLRFFGGFDFDETDLKATDIATPGYDKGVPMGGDLYSKGKTAPAFLIAAAKDPSGGNLDRIQVVKGWLNSAGNSEERVYDVVLSDGRTHGSQAVDNTVNLMTGAYTQSVGARQLATVWHDPDFEPTQSAFYYARVLEIPTPRYSLLDSIALGIQATATHRPATIQERVYSSPIWYTP